MVSNTNFNASIYLFICPVEGLFLSHWYRPHQKVKRNSQHRARKSKKAKSTEHWSAIVKKFVKSVSRNNDLNREKGQADNTSSGGEFCSKKHFL